MSFDRRLTEKSLCVGEVKRFGVAARMLTVCAVAAIAGCSAMPALEVDGAAFSPAAHEAKVDDAPCDSDAPDAPVVPDDDQPIQPAALEADFIYQNPMCDPTFCDSASSDR